MLTIGMVNKDEVILASPSHGFIHNDAAYLSSNITIFNPPLAKNMLVSYSGDTRNYQVIRYYNEIFKSKDLVNDELSLYYLSNYVLKGISKSLRESKIIDEDTAFDDAEGTTMVAYKNRLFALDPNGLGMEIKDYIVPGCNGYPEAMGVLDSVKDCEDPIYKILKMYSISLVNKANGFYPVVIVSSKDCKKFKFFNEEQTLKYIKKYERSHNI